MFTSAASGILLTTSGPRIHAAPSAPLPACARGASAEGSQVMRGPSRGEPGVCPRSARPSADTGSAVWVGEESAGPRALGSTAAHGRCGPRAARRESGVRFSPTAMSGRPLCPPPIQPRCRRREVGCLVTRGPSALTRKAPTPASWPARSSESVAWRCLCPGEGWRPRLCPPQTPSEGGGRHRGPHPEHGLGPHLPGPGGRHVPFQVAELYNRDSVPPHSAQLQRGPPQGQAQAPGRAWQSGAHGAGPRGPRRPGLQSVSVLSSEHGCAHFTRSRRSPSGTPGRLLDLPPATGWARADAWTTFQLRVGEVFTRFLGSFAVRPPPGFSTQQRSA